MTENKTPSFDDYRDGDDLIKPWQDDPSFNKDGDLSHWFGDKRHYRPWYDANADYNTNAKSYYDYLAYRVRQLDYMIKAINDLLKRDIATGDTDTVHMSKSGSWRDRDLVITLYADVKISQAALNAIVKKQDGLYVKDLQPDIDDLKARMEDLEKQVQDLNRRVTAMEVQLAQIAKDVAGLKTEITKIKNNLQQQIDKINDTINNIFTLINGGKYTKIPDTDFYYTWYNGSTDVPASWGKVGAKIMQTGAFSTVVIKFPWANPNYQNMKFNLGHVPLSSEPLSYIGGFGFKNQYAKLNTAKVTNIQFTADSPHVIPIEQRASWQIGYNLDTTGELHAEPFQVTMASISDGWNDKNTLQEHYTGISMQGAALTITLTLQTGDDSGTNPNPSKPDQPDIPSGDGDLITPDDPQGVPDLTRTVTRYIKFYDTNVPDNPNPTSPDQDTVRETKDVERKVNFIEV